MPGRLLYLLLLCTLPAAGQELGDSFTDPYYIRDNSMPDVKRLLDQGRRIEHISPDSACRLFLEAYRISRARKYTYGAGMSLMRLGGVISVTRDRKEALPVYQQALTYALQTRQRSNLIIMLHLNIASIYNHYGNYRKAADYLYAALSLTDETTPEQLAIYVYNSIGGLHMRFRQPEKTLHYLEKSEAIARKVNRPELLAFMLNNKAHTLATMERYEEAAYYYNEAIAQASLAGNEMIKDVCLIGIAEMLLGQGKAHEALGYLRPAAGRDSRSMSYLRNLYRNYLTGDAYLRTGQYGQAIQYLLRSIDTARKYQVQDHMYQVHTALAAAYGATGRYRDAWRHEQTASGLKDSLTDKERIKAVDQLEFKYQTVQKDMAIAKKDLLIANQENQIGKKNLLIAVVSISALTLVITMGLLYRNRQHRQRLQEQQLRDMEQEKALLEQEKEINIMHALVSGGEKERTRLAQELHDGVGGRLAALQMYFSSEQHTAGMKPEIRREIMHMLEDTAEEIRNTAHNLMPDILTRYSFEEALEMYCVQLGQGAQLHIDLQIHASVDGLPQEGQLSLYRIIQELLKNIVKHAGATNAAVQINRNRDLLTILIEDNGTGFVMEDQHPGLGLQNVQNRIGALNGTMTIESSPKHGTIIRLEINLQ